MIYSKSKSPAFARGFLFTTDHGRGDGGDDDGDASNNASARSDAASIGTVPSKAAR
jgi:hypothetical protein